METMTYKYNKNSNRKLPSYLADLRAKLMFQYRYSDRNEEEQELTLQELGLMFGITRERVRQIFEQYKNKFEF